MTSGNKTIRYLKWNFDDFNRSNFGQLKNDKRYCTEYFTVMTLDGHESRWCFDMSYNAASKSFSLYLIQKDRQSDDFTAGFEAYAKLNGKLLKGSHMFTREIEAKEFDESTKGDGAEWGFDDWIKVDSFEDLLTIKGGELVIFFEMTLASPTINLEGILDENAPNYMHDDSYSDCSILTSDEKEVNVHRFFLCKSSQYFQEIFGTSEMQDAKRRKIQLEFDSTVMNEILRFIYTQKICFKNVYMTANILMAADHLKMETLKSMATRELCYLVSEDDVFEMLTIAEHYCLDELISKCNQTLRIYFDELKEKPDWNVLKPSQFLKIIEQSTHFIDSCNIQHSHL